MEETQPSVLCLLPRMFDTRIGRRVELLKQAGFKVEALAFERLQDPGTMPDCPVASLGRIRHRHYTKRIFNLIPVFLKVRQAMRRNDIAYVFNIDMCILALLSGIGLNKSLLLETADILDIQVSRVRGALIRALDKRIARRCKLLILTSACYESYYRRWLGIETPMLVMENKLTEAFVGKVRKVKLPLPDEALLQERPFRIGWFGILREPWTLWVLDALIRADPQRFNVVLAGVFDQPLRRLRINRKLLERFLDSPNTEYRGPYSAPDDLLGLYGGVDLTMNCYQPTIPTCWSQTNKYYEACLFGKPLIARAGCSDAEKIERHDIGLVINGDNVREAVAQIRGISAEECLHWQTNIAALSPKTYMLTDEAKTLGNALCAIAARAA